MAEGDSEGALLGWLRQLAPGLGLTVVLIALGLGQARPWQETALSSATASAGAESALVADQPSSAEADPLLEPVGQREPPSALIEEAPLAAEPPPAAEPDVAFGGVLDPRDGSVTPPAVDPAAGDRSFAQLALDPDPRGGAEGEGAGLSLPSSGATGPIASSPYLVTHVVAPGDTLSALAARFGVNVESVRLANNLGPDSVLRIGQPLLVPTLNGLVHVVAPGDTISGIATGYGVDLGAVASANQLDGDLLMPGKRLLIPGGVRPSAPPIAATARRPAAPGGLAALTPTPAARRTAPAASPPPTPTPTARHR